MEQKTRGFLVAVARDAAAAARTGVPCVRLCYRIAEGGALQRAQAPFSGRGGLLGVYEAPGLSDVQPEKLARDLQAECSRRGCGGVVLDLEPHEGGSRAKMEEVCAALAKLRVNHCVPESMAALAPQGRVVAPAAVSGGSFDELLGDLCGKYGASRLCLDLVRTCSDFSMPSYSPNGQPLTCEAFHALQETYRAQSFFSPELCAKYFTYRKDNGSAHFVLFDDADTAAAKLRAARRREIGAVFLLYSEWGSTAKEILAGL
ncbi:MAG: hypothetical protein IJT76_09020 [Clostridia bacterium]|nr:hypothetical protein [Clostridia bacterium]